MATNEFQDPSSEWKSGEEAGYERNGPTVQDEDKEGLRIGMEAAQYLRAYNSQ